MLELIRTGVHRQNLNSHILDPILDGARDAQVRQAFGEKCGSASITSTFYPRLKSRLQDIDALHVNYGYEPGDWDRALLSALLDANVPLQFSARPVRYLRVEDHDSVGTICSRLENFSKDNPLSARFVQAARIAGLIENKTVQETLERIVAREDITEEHRVELYAALGRFENYVDDLRKKFPEAVQALQWKNWSTKMQEQRGCDTLALRREGKDDVGDRWPVWEDGERVSYSAPLPPALRDGVLKLIQLPLATLRGLGIVPPQEQDFITKAYHFEWRNSAGTRRIPEKETLL